MNLVPAWQLGKGLSEHGNRYAKYVLAPCVDCGWKRWVQVRNGAPDNPRCRACAGRKKSQEMTKKNLREIPKSLEAVVALNAYKSITAKK